MAQYEEFTIDQGSDLSIQLQLLNATDRSRKNLTGYSVVGKIKKTFSSDSDQTTDLTCTIIDPASDGLVLISLTNAQTDSLTPGAYVYDVKISHTDSDNNTSILRVVEGRMYVSASVSR